MGYRFLKYSFFFCLLVGCTNRQERRSPQPSDTLYTAEAAMEVYAYEPERALTIIDSALIVGNINEDVAKLLRAKVYSQSLMELQIDTAQQMLLELLECDYTKDLHNREVVLDLLFNIARNKHQVERQLYWATLKADCCREQGHETEALRTEAEIGYLLTLLGEVEKGLSKLNGVIASLDGQRHVDEMDVCVIALKRKINVLRQLGRQEEVIPLAQHIIKIINDYREHYNEYTDNSYRLPKTLNQTEKYCSFCTSQAQGFLVNAYAELGSHDSARYYLSLFEQSDFGNTLGGRRMIAPALCLLGDYGKMLAIYDEEEKRLGDDTINAEYAVMLRGRALATQAAGNSRQAATYWKRYAELNNHVNRKLQQSQAYEYAARYHLQEERLKTENEERRAENNRNMAIAGFLLVLIAIVFIVWLLVQRRAIRRKNRVLVDQISEILKYKSLVEGEGLNVKDKTADVISLSTSHLPPSENLSNEELFRQISEIVHSEKLFLDPLFGRQTLIDRLHISKNRIGAAFTQGSQYSSMSDFVRDLRLEYACRMLSDRPDMTISDIAAASGFSSPTVFGRDFKRKYEVSPSYYRQQSAGK